jgi:hypothetical protein
MKTPAFLLAAALLLPAAGAFAQPATFVAPLALGATASQLSASGSVTYFGVVSTHDARHEQFARLRQALAASQATVVLFEKPDVGVDSTEVATIERLGEMGYVRLLAQQHGLATERLDDPVAEYEYLRTRTEATQLKLYYLLRANQQFCRSTGASKAIALKHMQALLKNSATYLPGVEQVIQNQAEFEVAYRHLCPAGGRWWQRTVTDAQPQANRPAEAFVQAINDSLRAYRAQRLAQLVAQKVQAGERVLVVLDPSHLPAPTTYAVGARAGR